MEEVDINRNEGNGREGDEGKAELGMYSETE